MAELEIKPTVAARGRVAGRCFLRLGITGTLVFLLSGGGPDCSPSKPGRQPICMTQIRSGPQP